MERSKVSELSRLIRQDISRRSLMPGDPYLTDQEVGKTFNVHTRTASRAMRLLADRSVLVRRRGAGTFVGPQSEETVVEANPCIYVLVGHTIKHFDDQGGPLIAAIRQELPSVDVHFSFLPKYDAERFVERLLEQRVEKAAQLGLVLMACTRPVQELISQRRLPTVVFGSTFASAASLESLDWNWYETGRLEARWLIEHGHRRLALLMRESWLPGDNNFYDGVSYEIGQAELLPGSLVIRSLSAEGRSFDDEIESLMDMENGPTGFICRTGREAVLVKQAAESRSREIPKDVGIIFSGDEKTLSEVALPQVCASIGYAQQARRVATLLRQLLAGEVLSEHHVTVPVRLVEPNVKNGNGETSPR